MPQMCDKGMAIASVTIPCMAEDCRARITMSMRRHQDDDAASAESFEKMKQIAHAFALEEGWNLETWLCPLHKEA